jgi:hypothetical protein
MSNSKQDSLTAWGKQPREKNRECEVHNTRRKSSAMFYAYRKRDVKNQSCRTLLEPLREKGNISVNKSPQ